MIELLYHSEAGIAFDDKLIESILTTARDRNAKEDITGMLFFDGETFIQILEGPEERVDRVFASICQDNRHCKIGHIYRGQIFERSFADWRMGYKFTSALTGLLHEYDWQAQIELTKASQSTVNPGAQFFHFMNQSFLKTPPATSAV